MEKNECEEMSFDFMIYILWVYFFSSTNLQTTSFDSMVLVHNAKPQDFTFRFTNEPQSNTRHQIHINHLLANVRVGEIQIAQDCAAT